MIRSSTHHWNDLNKRKSILLHQFLDEYHDSVSFYVDYLWNNIPKDWDVPKYIDSSIKPDSDLSARALKCAATQASAIVRAVTKPMQKRAFVIKKHMREGKDVRKLQRIQDRNAHKLLVMGVGIPVVSHNIGAELNSICADLQDNGNCGVIQLKSLGKKYGKLRLPFKYHNHGNVLKRNGIIKNSFLIKKDCVDLRWDISKPNKVSVAGRRVVGADQGIVTCLTLSDGQITKPDIHGHDFRSIIKKLVRKKRGSKAFRRAQAHRRNYINWSINQLDFSEICEFRLEKLRHVRRGKKSKGRYMNSFSYPLIRQKVEDICLRLGVQFCEQNPTYRSQRCNECGYVHKSSRKGKLFVCGNCHMTMDADLNAALNHAVDLYALPSRFWQMKLNLIGFYWKSDGLYDSFGQQLTVAAD